MHRIFSVHIFNCNTQNVFMVAIKRVKSALMALICSICLIFAFLPTVNANANSADEIYLGGFAAGFMLNTKNVEVIGLCEVDSESGLTSPAREAGVMPGDVIKKINGVQITSVAKLTQTLNENYSIYNFDIERNNQTIALNVKPIKNKNNGKKQFGMLVKDTINGIGTVTYVNKSNLTFGSLGHPVSDSGGNVMDINGGVLYGCNVYDVKKGMRGNPGELKGVFDNAITLGKITINNCCGIYGNVNKDYDFNSLKKVTVGNISSVEMGKAYIYSTLYGQECDKYEISIIKVDKTNKENKNFVIKINDERIIERAGGIVQGMSGSPIVQNDKLIGAITHVFINDPTRGYGIAIENMLNS